MLKIFLLSIGLMLVFEGLVYFLFSSNIHKFLNQLKDLNPQTLRTISTFIFGLGLCLIYFTLRFYGEN